MTRRRFFRVLTLTLLLLCLGAWGLSCLDFGFQVRGGFPRYWVRFERDSFYLSKEDTTPILHWGMSRRVTLFELPLKFTLIGAAALTAWAWRKRRSEGERGFAVEQDQLREESREKTE